MEDNSSHRCLVLVCLWAILGSWDFVQASNFTKCVKEGGFLLSKAVCLPQSYRRTTRPFDKTVVDILIQLIDLRELDETKMTMTSKVSLEFVWPEPRLLPDENVTHDIVIETSDSLFMDKLWQPSHYIMNLVQFQGEIQRS